MSSGPDCSHGSYGADQAARAPCLSCIAKVHVVSDPPTRLLQSQATANGELPRTVYGAEHLVRLFVKLPELVPVAHMTPQDAVRLEAFLHGLMQHASGPAQAQLFSSREQYVPNQAFAPELLLPPAAPTGTAGAAARRPPPGALATPEPSRGIAVS